MAENREAGAYRGDSYRVMENWSEATIERYYENRSNEAEAKRDTDWKRAAGIDFDKVEAQMVATYGYLPERFGGPAE